MKKIVIPILFLFALSSWSQSFEEQFSTANGLYKDGDFNKAVELYLSIENEGVESADLYFNLGNCYYKMNKVAPSIYYYEKALKLDPIHEDAQFNLAFAKRMTIDLIEELPKTFLQRFSENVIQKQPDRIVFFLLLSTLLPGQEYSCPRQPLFHHQAIRHSA